MNLIHSGFSGDLSKTDRITFLNFLKKGLEMMKLRLFLYCLIIFLLASCGEQSSRATPTLRTTPSVMDILAELKLPNPEDINAFECPKEHPDFFPSGQTVAWVNTRKEKLESSGIYVRWNCETKAYELTIKDDLTPKCQC